MRDHFVLLVDRLLTESTLEPAIESRNRSMQATLSAIDNMKAGNTLHKMDFGSIPSTGTLVECRICQDEDEDSNMETPCSCCGSMKYAHRRCIQRWCNEKGDTMCEICHQQFNPGYTAPPPPFQFGSIPMSFRRDLNNPQFIAVVSAESNFPDSHYDEYSASTTRSLICYRSVAAIFMVLLILRHTLPVLISKGNEYSFPLFTFLFVRAAGIILPIYIILRAVTAIQNCRHRQIGTGLAT